MITSWAAHQTLFEVVTWLQVCYGSGGGAWGMMTAKFQHAYNLPRPMFPCIFEELLCYIMVAASSHQPLFLRLYISQIPLTGKHQDAPAIPAGP